MHLQMNKKVLLLPKYRARNQSLMIVRARAAARKKKQMKLARLLAAMKANNYSKGGTLQRMQQSCTKKGMGQRCKLPLRALTMLAGVLEQGWCTLLIKKLHMGRAAFVGIVVPRSGKHFFGW